MNSDTLKLNRKIAKAAITRVENWVDSELDSVTDMCHIELRKETLKNGYQKYCDIQDFLDCYLTMEENRK